MTDLRDWSTSASDNNGTALNGYLAEGVNYTLVSDAFREQQAQLARWLADNNGTLTSTGTSATYTLAINQGLTTYKDGDTVMWTAHLSNVGSATMQMVVSGTTSSAMPIVHTDTTELVDGDIYANGIYECVYKSASANFQLLNPSTYKTFREYTQDNSQVEQADGYLYVENIAVGSGMLRDVPRYFPSTKSMFLTQLYGGVDSARTFSSNDVNKTLTYSDIGLGTWTMPASLGHVGAFIRIVNPRTNAGPTLANVTSASGNLTVEAKGSVILHAVAADDWHVYGDLQA